MEKESPTTTENGADDNEEVDLNSLQQGLAKAMVLQWNSTHPDEALDDIIAQATQATGRYNDTLAEKGIDKTLYEQWRFVKLKSKAKTAARPAAKKPLSFVLPDRSSRPTRASVAAKEGLQIEKKVVVQENGGVMSPITEQSPMSEGVLVAEYVSTGLTFKGGEGLENGKDGDVPGGVVVEDGEGVEKDETTEVATKSPVQKTEVDIASYKAKIAKLKQNLNTFNKEKENLPKIEKVEFERKDFELDSYEPITPGLGSLSSSKAVDPEAPQAETKPDSPKAAEESDVSNKDKIEQLKKNMAKFSKEKEEARKENVKVSSPSAERPKVESNNETSNLAQSTVKQNEIEATKATATAKTQENEKNNDQNSFTQEKEFKKVKNLNENLNKAKREEKQEDTENENEDVKKGLEKGYAKKIMDKLITETQTKVVEKRIKLIVDDSAAGLEALELGEEEGDVKENAAEAAKQVVKEGTARQLVGKWKENEIIRSSNNAKVRVEIKEEDGKVAESVPEVREGVVRADESLDVVTVEKGATKGLLNQWQNRPQSSEVGKRQIIISEDDGRVAENEPVLRDGVVRSSDTAAKIPVEKGKTKNLLDNWQNMKQKEAVRKKIEINEEDGRCVESEPSENPGVVRAVDRLEDDVLITKGKTGQLLGQWQQQGSVGSEGSSRDRTPFVISEKDGKVSENQPMTLDIAREGDEQEDAAVKVVQRGMARNLREQWQKLEEEKDFKKENRVLILEEDGKVAENEPVQLDDVARESEVVNDTHVVNKGLTKGLLNQWQSGVGGAQLQRQVAEVKGGMTKSLLSQWSQKGSEQFQSSKKDIVLNEDEGYVAENTPEERGDGVVQSGGGREETRGQTGQTKKAKELLMSGTYKHQGRKEPIKLWDDGVDARSVVENEPQQRSDVCREEDSSLDVVATKGFAKGIVGKWGQQKGSGGRKEVKLEYAEGPAVFESEPTPSLTYTKHHAKSSGVFENQPNFREDVTREIDVIPEVIPASVARSAKKLWSQKEQEAANPAFVARKAQMVRFTPEREMSPPS